MHQLTTVDDDEFMHEGGIGDDDGPSSTAHLQTVSGP